MRELSLFSGAGGGLLGTKLLGWEAVGYVEFNEYCQRVLRARIDDGILDDAPMFGDIRAFIGEGYARAYQGMVDVVSGGFPCQPFSQAGKRAGENDSRNMWGETLEVIRQVRPRFAFLENVSGLLSIDDGRYFGRILGDLGESGYDVRWRVLSAAEVGAPHKRDRLWIVADSIAERQRRQGLLSQQQGRTKTISSGEVRERGEMAHTRSERTGGEVGTAGADRGRGIRGDESTLRQGNGQDGADRTDSTSGAQGEIPDTRCEHGESGNAAGMETCKGKRASCYIYNQSGGQGWWDTDPADPAGTAKPELGRVAHGVANRMDRLKAIGNGQVPIVAATAWRLLSKGLV